MVKLYMLKLAMLIATWLIKKFFKQPYKTAATWLFHYLKGSGTTMVINSTLMDEESKEVLIGNALEHFGKLARKYEWDLPHMVTVLGGGPYKTGVYGTTQYSGAGFYGRPILFYTVARFEYNYQLYRDTAGNYRISIWGQDVYDWHPEIDEWSGEECFFTTPLNRAFVIFMNALFGEEYFPISGWPMGQPGMSNKLLMHMTKVNAKPFTTHIYLNKIIADSNGNLLVDEYVIEKFRYGKSFCKLKD